MPKILAPTLAAHRAAQRSALIAAGEAILVESGLPGVSPRTVTERAGMSRSSFYDYFGTRDDLLVAIAIEAIESWDADIETALAGTAPGTARLEAFVEATMAMAADGRHTIASALRSAELSPSRFEDLMALHDSLMRPVREVLAELDVLDPANTAYLVQGVLGAGMELIAHGADHRVVAADTVRLLSSGLAR